MIGILNIYIVITTLHYKTSRTHEHTNTHVPPPLFVSPADGWVPADGVDD